MTKETRKPVITRSIATAYNYAISKTEGDKVVFVTTAKSDTELRSKRAQKEFAAQHGGEGVVLLGADYEVRSMDLDFFIANSTVVTDKEEN